MSRTRQPSQSTDSSDLSDSVAGAAAGGLAALSGGIGNAGLIGMLPGLGTGLPGLGDLPGLPGLDDLPGLIPDIPFPGFNPTPMLPDLPDLGGLGDLLPDMPDLGPIAGPLQAGEEAMDAMSQIYEEEGFSGLLDPEGAMDRHAARSELASRFQVVDDDFCGPRTGNQVTRDEYERIVQEYSDIRLGRTDLQIDTAGLSDADAAAFRSGTMSDIADIMQTESGRGLIGSLAHAPGHGFLGLQDTTTTISRRNNAAGAPDPSNATGGGRFGESGFASYVPGVNTAPGGANIRSDVTLYHELTHAHHAVYNTWDSNAVTAANGGTTQDVAAGINQFEYQAAGLGQYANNTYSENRYRGERRQIGASGVGARNTGSETDANMSRRTTYAGFSPGGTPATIPAAPGTAIPGITPTPSSSGGSGDAGRIGQSTGDHDHDHDHDHH